MVDLLKNLTGIFGNLWRLGGATGPQLKNASSVFELRNSDDSGYVKGRCAAPVGDYDIVNKYYADSLEKPLIVKRQANCSAALPANTGVRGWVAVTTAGTGAVIGDILYDDGTGVGNMTIVVAVEGRTIIVTDELTGGTIYLHADTLYVWDSDGSEWIEAAGAEVGVRKCISFSITTATADSAEKIPANAKVINVMLKIDTPYSAGGLIDIGTTGDTDLVLDQTENNPEVANTYLKEQLTAWGGASGVVRATVSGAPAAGAATILVEYSKPRA